MHPFSCAYNENTVISKEYPCPLDFDITGVDRFKNFVIQPQGTKYLVLKPSHNVREFKHKVSL